MLRRQNKHLRRLLAMNETVLSLTLKRVGEQRFKPEELRAGVREGDAVAQAIDQKNGDVIFSVPTAGPRRKLTLLDAFRRTRKTDGQD